MPPPHIYSTGVLSYKFGGRNFGIRLRNILANNRENIFSGDKNRTVKSSRFPLILKYANFQDFIISKKRSVSATFNLADAKIISADAKIISTDANIISTDANIIPAMVKIIPAIVKVVMAFAKVVSATMFQGIALMCEPSANASGISAIANMLPVTISCCNIAAETTPALISYCNIAAGIETARAGVASALAV